MSKNKVQPHGVFKNDTLIWTFVSRKKGFEAFDIPSNGPGTKENVRKLQEEGFLPLKAAPGYQLQAIDHDTYKTTKLDFSRTDEVIAQLKSGGKVTLPKIKEHLVTCSGPCERKLTWTEENFSPQDKDNFSELRTTCRDCRKQKCRNREGSFKTQLADMKAAGETHFTCNKCNNHRHLSLISTDRMICRPCVERQKRKVHANKDPNTSPDGKACATCGAQFSRQTFGWRPEVGSWRLQCNDCCKLKYDCPMCGLFKVPTPESLCHVDRQGEGRIKRFEEEMKEFLQARDLHWSYQDQVFPCSKPGELRRPDFALVFLTFILIIEVDEHYHKRYNPHCELKRLEQLHETAKLPIVVIRFNPHSRHYGILGSVIDDIIRNDGAQASTDNPFGIYLHFIGYPYQRILVMKDHMEADIGTFFPYSSVGEIA